MTIKKFKEFLSEEWLVVDKEKNCVISKHGEDEKGATVAGRKLDFINWNKTHKLGRFGILATHGPQMAVDKPDQFAKAGDKKKKKAASKAKTPAKKATAKPTSKAAPAAKKPSLAKAKAKTPGQGGGLGTQIGSLIAKHMAKMFKEETEIKRIVSRHSRKLYQQSL